MFYSLVDFAGEKIKEIKNVQYMWLSLGQEGQSQTQKEQKENR